MTGMEPVSYLEAAVVLTIRSGGRCPIDHPRTAEIEQAYWSPDAEGLDVEQLRRFILDALAP
ncbi:MAG: hypothetical protein ACKVWR_12375 [Acidimicrobiales bacterium]